MSDSAFEMLPSEAFPVTLRAFDDNDNIVWTETIEKPETLVSVYVPPLAKTHGPVEVEVEFATGEKHRGA